MGFTWTASDCNQQLPATAVFGGKDSDGSEIFIGRAEHAGENITAKVIPAKKTAYVSYNGKEIPKESFEVLCEDNASFHWIPCKDIASLQTENAVSTGETVKGEILYIGRAEIKGSLTPGKIHLSHSCLYIPYDGEEHTVTENFEVLTAKQKPTWYTCSIESELPEGAISAGNDLDGSTIYLCRAEHNGDLIPGKFIPSKRMAFIAYDGLEIAKDYIEVLCHGDGNISWKASGFGDVPVNALPGGRTAKEEILYVGRAKINGQMTPGKIAPSQHALLIPFDGTEIALSKYEILVQKP